MKLSENYEYLKIEKTVKLFAVIAIVLLVIRHCLKTKDNGLVFKFNNKTDNV